MGIYENNLLAIKETNNILYQELIKTKTNSTFEVFAQDNLENANILDSRSGMFIYKNEPVDEIDDFMKNFKEYSNYRVLYFYGIGNGHLFKKILKYKFLDRLTIFEPEIELIYIALNLVDFSKELKRKSLVIYYTKIIDFAYIYQNLHFTEPLYFKTYNLFLTSDYYDNYQQDMIDTNKLILRIFSHTVNATGNSYYDSLKGLKQFLHNIPSMISNPSLVELTKKAAISDTAIIISTGPSLPKQLPLLKKIKDKALLISLDASMPILEKHGIKPDIVVTQERSEITAEFYKKTSKEFQKGITFVIGVVAHKDLVDARVEGNLVHFMRPVGSYFNYFEFNHYGYIGLGMSSANLAYELASNIDLKQIILIGQDLAYSKEGLSHSKDHIVGEDEWVPNENDDFIEAYGGLGKVRTMHWWKLFLNAYENAIALNNNTTDIKTINATEAGARIHGSIELSFKDATDKYLKDTKKSFTLASPSPDLYKKNMHSAIEKLDSAIDIGNSMYKRSTKLLKKITTQINLHSDIAVEDIAQNLKNGKNRELMEEITAIREKYYGPAFQSFYIYLLAPLIGHIEFDMATVMVLQDDTDKKSTIKDWKLILFHHEWLLRVAANLKAIIEVLVEAKRDWTKILDK